MSVYPSAVLSVPVYTDEIDVVAASITNTSNNEIIALQTYVGTNPQGHRNNLSDRMNALSSGSGGFYVTNADFDSVNTYPGRFWYRNDLEALRSVRSDNSIQTIGGSFSNNIFNWGGAANGVTTGSNGLPVLYGSSTGSFATYFDGKFKKISGISTVLVYTKVWMAVAGVGNAALSRLKIGTVSGSAFGSVDRTTPEWITFSIDVSGLTNGVVYDLIGELSASGGANKSFVSATLGIGQ